MYIRVLPYPNPQKKYQRILCEAAKKESSFLMACPLTPPPPDLSGKRNFFLNLEIAKTEL